MACSANRPTSRYYLLSVIGLKNCFTSLFIFILFHFPVITMGITAFLVVGLHGVVMPAMAGLALSYSWHISGVLQYTTRLLSEAEVRFISVERILAYIDTTVNEEKQCSSKISPSWPNQGHIRFHNVCMTYRKNLPNCLHNVTFSIKSGEKIGWCKLNCFSFLPETLSFYIFCFMQVLWVAQGLERVHLLQLYFDL